MRFVTLSRNQVQSIAVSTFCWMVKLGEQGSHICVPHEAGTGPTWQELGGDKALQQLAVLTLQQLAEEERQLHVAHFVRAHTHSVFQGTPCGTAFINPLVRSQWVLQTEREGGLCLMSSLTVRLPAGTKNYAWVPSIRSSNCENLDMAGRAQLRTQDEEGGSELKPVLAKQHEGVLAGGLCMFGLGKVSGQEVSLLVLVCAPV